MEVKIVGNVATVVTPFGYATLKDLFPKGLEIKDDKDKVVYAVKAGKVAAWNQYGVEFNTQNAEGKALIQFDVKEGITAEEFAKQYVDAIAALDKYSNNVKAALEGRKACIDEATEHIEIG